MDDSDSIHSCRKHPSNLDLNIDKWDLCDPSWLRRGDDGDDNDCCGLVETASMRHSMTSAEQEAASLSSCCNKLDRSACDDE